MILSKRSFFSARGVLTSDNLYFIHKLSDASFINAISEFEL